MLYDRVINAKIRLAEPIPNIGYRGDLSIKNLRMSFSVYKTLSISANTASLKIYNLSPNNRNQLNNYGNLVDIYAGYRDNGGSSLLFTGNNTLVSHIFSFPDIISIMDCGDGENVLNGKIVKISFGANTPVRTIIEEVARQMGLPVVDFAQTENLVYSLGYEDIDMGKIVLDVITKKLNLNWSIQNGNIVILRNNEGNSKEISLINIDTGMVGIPERYTDKRQYLYTALPPNLAPRDGWKVKTLLRPDLLPGDRIRLKSTQANIDGIFYILTIRHEGDNFGPLFESNLEVIAI